MQLGQTPAPRVLVVGATGHLVARLALSRGLRVRALVRPSSDADALTRLGIDIVRGDLLDRSSLYYAVRDCDAVIATAIGYANRKKGDIASATDTQGNRNLADAALAAQLPRLVFCSVLSCDRAKEVPHFWHKKLAEDYFEKLGIPFVALRPGAFLDQGSNDFWAEGLRDGRLRFAANPSVPATFVHTDDVARYLLDATTLSVAEPALRIDIGCDRPVSIVELALLMTKALHRPIRPQVPPWPVVSAALTLAGIFDPWKRDLKAMMAYIQRGGYVADVTLQTRYFGPPPKIEDGVERYLAGAGLLAAAIPDDATGIPRKAQA